MSAPMSIEERVRQAAIAARSVANTLEQAMNEAHAIGVNFEVGVQFNNSRWEIKLIPFTRAPIKLEN